MGQYPNGNYPDSALASIPGGRLAKEPAAAWNAMCAAAQKRGLPIPMPDGPDSTYRPYGRQLYWKQYWCAQGHCENAATPGTSHHGAGEAVDCDAANHNDTIRQIGQEFGWSKLWSDAPWESWHHSYKYGIWHRKPGWITSQKGSVGSAVLVITSRLATCGYVKRPGVVFNQAVENGVKAFQTKHHLAADGVIGPETGRALKSTAAWCKAHHRKDV